MDTDNFRDHISTVSDEGKRVWVHPHKPKGRYNTYRQIVAFILISLMFGLPFVSVSGRPLFLFDIINRKFYLFGVGFWPQDFHIFLFMMISLLLFIILFTVIFGRIWCGWACPQTIFMEMVFRKIEYWIEGDARQQIKLNAEPNNPTKFFKKSLKHGIFIILSWMITNSLLAWIVGIDELFKIMTEPISEHTGGFVAMLFFTGFLYWVYASFREQICTLVCPYGRLQGVLLDEKSILVHYDFLRGEPRTKKKTEGGDCIDCHHCVDVCPTGIDIRNGTQLECINCTACMDACDSIMTKIKKPTGLIRYASFNGIKNGVEKIFNARTIGYSAILLILLSLVTFFLTTRQPIEATILRTPGSTFQKMADGQISNLFNVQIANKTFDEVTPTIVLKNPSHGKIRTITSDMIVKPEGLLQTAFFVYLSPEKIQHVATPLEFEVLVGEKLIQTVRSSFISPGIK
ncbi:MAG: cytochrome c oxidase accessory protein CcoG [Candidatus Marinimicrobia bacterium]|nr:cytochrome c oxidase accessory protein CcoG [Candidatus Neomarinimicrobiota bacterium]